MRNEMKPTTREERERETNREKWGRDWRRDERGCARKSE